MPEAESATRDERTERAALRLLSAYSSGVPIPPLRISNPTLSIEEAYRIQRLQHARWVADGRQMIGRKIGLTSPAMQEQLGVDQPDWGAMFADTKFRSGESVSLQRFIAPRIEPEIAFVMARPLDEDDLTPEGALQAIASFSPALEIIDSRIAAWDIGLVDTVADNASFGAFVIGESLSPDGTDFTALTCRLRLNNHTVATGRSDAVVGSPINSLLWLGRLLAAGGERLEAGDIVLTGSVTSAVAVAAGDEVVAAFEDLPEVRFAFLP